jgi:hypothetical protein
VRLRVLRAVRWPRFGSGAFALLASALFAGRLAAQPVNVEASQPTEPTEPTEATVESGAVAPRVNTQIFGPPQAAPLESHLGSSSRAKADINEGDSFDLGRQEPAGAAMSGAADAPGILGDEPRPRNGVHVVQAGDTLSKISQQVYGQPWLWPKLWSQNPQIQNPHWIYPGDQILLSGAPGPMVAGRAQTLGSGGFPIKQQLVPQDTVFLRQVGYIDDPAKGILGEIVGAIEPVQLMAQGQQVYIVIKPDQTLSVGQKLTIFRQVREPPKVEGARTPPGKLVALQGTVRIDYVNQSKHIARAEILESTEVIERGAKVGFVENRYQVVPPKKIDKDVTARVLTSMHPHVFMGQNQVVFIDRGSIDGLAPGHRLFVTRRGDTWRRTLSTTKLMARTRINIDAEELTFEAVPLNGDEQDFPEEVVAELRVIRAHKFSSLAIVAAAKVEVVVGDRAIGRAGF